MTEKSYPLSKVYGLLEPGPVVLLSTAGSDRPDIMTLSWHTMIEFEPPLIGCVVNIPTLDIAETVVGCGNAL